MSRRGNKPYTRPAGEAAGPRADRDGQWLHDRAPGYNGGRASNEPRPRHIPTASDDPSAKLVITNLHYEVTEKDLASLFGQFGTFVRGPTIRYDRSGRSTGTAFITYSTMGEAMAAKKKLDWQLAKGQELSIKFENTPTGPRGGARPSGGAHSLLERVQKPSLAARLSEAVPNAPPPSGPGPIRNKPRQSAPAGPAKDRASRERPPLKKPLTAEDLDKQLDMYTAESSSTNKDVESGPIEEPKAAPAMESQDVEMA